MRVREDEVIADEIQIAKFDIKTVTDKDLKRIVSSFSFKVKKDCVFHGFTIWFDVTFASFSPDLDPVVLSNSPYTQLTHWKQDCFLMSEGGMRVIAGDGNIFGIFIFKKSV